MATYTRLALVASLFLACDPDPDSVASAESGGTMATSKESGSTGAAQSILLVGPDDWSLAPESADPFPDHRPPNAECDAGYGPEYGVFEVDAGVCTYGAFEQPTKAEIREGDEVTIDLVHDTLWAEEPAVAHLALVLDGTTIWETELPIPNQYALLQATWQPDRTIPKGTALHFHLHNHGYNTYRLVEIRALR